MNRDLRHVDYFLFTQHSLATFDNCPLKFKKRYIENLKWDALPDENIKKRIEMGNDFHLLAYRYFMGIEQGLDEAVQGYGDLERWLESLMEHFPKKKGVVYLPEYKMRISQGSLKLEANIDLVSISEDSVEIWDWKTHSGTPDKKRSLKSQKLADSLQTKVYMFVLKEQIKMITGRDTECEKIVMRYWQPDPPEVIAEVHYNSNKHEGYGSLLKNKINTILEYDYSLFDKELYSGHCKFCEFNWFCNNAGVDYSAIEENEGFIDELDWGSIEEKY